MSKRMQPNSDALISNVLGLTSGALQVDGAKTVTLDEDKLSPAVEAAPTGAVVPTQSGRSQRVWEAL